MLKKWVKSKKMKYVVSRKVVGVCIITILSCFLYSVADNKITPGGYADLHDLKQLFVSYVYTPDFKGKYAFINIDDATYEAMNDPDFTSPELITRLVNLVDKSNPVLLVMDIDLRPSIESNQNLIDYLENHESFPILLTDHPSKVTNIFAWRKQNLLDAVVKKNPNIFWVSTLFYPQSDGLIRQSPYFSLFCVNDKLVVRPSVSLAVRVLNNFDIDQANAIFSSAEIRSSSNVISCDSVNLDDSYVYYGLPGTDKGVELRFNNQSFDIQYAIIKGSHNVDKKSNLVVIESSAKGLVPEMDVNDINTDVFNERIIVIGGTNFKSKDIHETPIGSQHGAYLILNAIESALNIKSPYVSQQSRSYLILILFAVSLGVAAVIFRNTALVVISLLLLFSIPRIFNNLYTIELFVVLTVILIVEIVIEIYELVKRLRADYKSYGYRFALASEFRKPPRNNVVVKSFKRINKRINKIINRVVSRDKCK